MNFKLPTSNILVLGSNSVHCLLPSTLITRADALLNAHRLEEAVELADQQLKRLQGRVTLDTEEADELRYVYQRIGFQCLTETLFDDAGKHFFAGNLDPRVLISYYPELRGSLFSSDDSVDMFAGVTEHMPPEDSIDDIISVNIVRNYSPHLAPNTSTAPVAVELRDVLKVAATEMLKVFLRKWRTKRRDKEIGKCKADRDRPGKTVNEVVDTVLVRLYTTSGETTDLLALIEGPNDIVVEEIERLLSESHRFDALCKLYRSRGQEAKLLNVWSKLVAGEVIDEDVHDPLESMFTYLTEKKDKDLIQEWGVWLLKWDSERAMKLLTSVGGGKRGTKPATTEDTSLLQRIHESDPAAGVQYVEHLVLQRRSQDPSLHTQLASTYIEQLLECLEDEATSKLWRAKSASYTSSSSSTSPSTSFLSYFASTTPDSASKRTRLKTLFFLQTSKLYDFEAVKARLEGLGAERSKVLALESAIVLGKLGRHREALSLLVHTLHDSVSAEAYCALGGEVIPHKISQTLAERFSIPILAPPLPLRSTEPNRIHRERSVTGDEGLKKELTKVLLDVYMSGGDAMAESTARLLDAQAMNLDVLDVISDVPPTWPLRALSSFLSRSFRRTLHTHHESQLIKALAASENLAVAESSWLALREGGAIVEEEDPEADDEDEKVVREVSVDGEVGGLGLETSLDEKASFREHDHGPGQEVGGYNVDEDDESVDLR